ncbi:MAG TPA: serine hydrolase domain-containing protein [Ilumatobacteraceae bacterium]|nr:serine hydrolase domain-containing protein [Ilumatobacteraceae bacterium]
MAPSMIDTAFGLIARRCPTPNDLEIVTHYGEESGSGEEADALWALVQEVYRSGMHPGIQICIRSGGEVVLDRAIGHARGVVPGQRFDRNRAVPLALDTPINLFSAAKAVTGMAMHKLEETGVIDLDDEVSKHVPGFEQHGKGSITIRHVLTHRAGIASMPPDGFNLDRISDPVEVEQIVCGLRPTTIPGAIPGYHAVTGGLIMEAVTRRATGRSLREVLATEIKEPLGLDWFDYGVAPGDVDRVARNVETGVPLGPVTGLFVKRALGKSWGEILQMSNDPRFLSAVVPSANVITTARDVGVFYQCIMDGGSYEGTRVFAEETVQRALDAPHDELVIDRMLGLPIRYASGFMLGTESIGPYGWDRQRAFGHIGMSNLFTWADPDRELVVAFLTTGKPVIGTHMLPLLKLLTGINEIFPRPE